MNSHELYPGQFGPATPSRLDPDTELAALRARCEAAEKNATDADALTRLVVSERNAAERSRDEARAEVERLRAQVGHAGWVGGMVLGICEGAPGWESVKEYPAGPEVEAWGAPSIVAAKALRRERDEAREALRQIMDAIEADITACGTADCERCEWLMKLPLARARRVLSGEKEGAPRRARRVLAGETKEGDK